MVYEGYKLKNIYLCKDGRLRAYLHNGQDNKIVSYPKYLMEVYLDKYLADDDVIHHIDCNPLNNEISNLQIIKLKDHASLHNPVLEETFICPMCRKEFILEGNKYSKYKSNKKRNRDNLKLNEYVGPFCGRSCAGKWSAMIQNKL